MPDDVTVRPASARSVGELRALVEAGTAVKYLHFWGHQPEPDGSPGKGSLSQSFEAPFVVDGVRYRTAEHWMMAEKARLFGDAEAEVAAIDAANPALAKAAGRTHRADRKGRDSVVVLPLRSVDA